MLENRSQQLDNKLREYVVLQFETNRILMQHRSTKKKFLYREFHSSSLCKTFLQCVTIRKSAESTAQGFIDVDFYTVGDNQQLSDKVGILFQHYITDLEKELANRIRTRPRAATLQEIGYTEEQLMNTFVPVIKTLRKMHEWEVIHGCLRGNNIIINEDYELKLCDAFRTGFDGSTAHVINYSYFAPEYPSTQTLTKENDLWALGLTILESACLKSCENLYKRDYQFIDETALQAMIKEIEAVYSDQFIVGLKLLLSSKPENRENGIGVLCDKILPPAFQYLRPYRKPIHKERQCESESPKKITSYNSIRTERPFDMKNCTMNNEQRTEYDITMTPLVTTAKKTIQKENQGKIQEKKIKIDLTKDKFKSRAVEDSELKKKQIDKINKIIQRSNAFVNQLMVKKQEKAKMPSLNKTAVIPGTSFILQAVGTLKLDSNNENTGKTDKFKEQFTLVQARKKEQYQATITPNLKESPTKLRSQIQTDKLRSASRKK